MSPYKQKIIDQAGIDDHQNNSIIKEALDMYWRKKKLQMIKGIQFVMREKPRILTQDYTNGKRTSMKQNDSNSEKGSEMSVMSKKQSLGLKKMDSYMSYNDKFN